MPRRRDADIAPLLVLGLGNLLCSDDGLGLEAVARLARDYRAPPDVRIVDGGTLGLALLPEIEEAHRAILVDAVRAALAPGSLVRLDGNAVVPAVRERLSPHDVGVWDLLWAARLRGRGPERLAVLGLVPASLDVGVGLTPAVEAGLARLVHAVAATARAWGHPFAQREESARWRDSLA